MFGLLKSKKSYQQVARDVYAQILRQVRQPRYYEECGVPDTFDGRFDLMVVFIFLVLQRMIEEGREEAMSKPFRTSTASA